MNTSTLTTWQTFKATLEQHPDLTLQFQYATNKWVDASYHITEVKQAPITSVDCGGVMNAWTEIIIQLWEPTAQDSEQAMQVSKALAIIALVENSLPLNPVAVVKIEFGNSEYDTRQLYPGEFIIKDGNLIVDLTPDFTQCKAISRGGSCGTTDSAEACCAPVTEIPQVEIKNLAVTAACCTPDSNCC